MNDREAVENQRKKNIQAAEKKDNNYDLVVVGMGPAGLAAAFEAARNGRERILLIEKRSESQSALRMQTVILDSYSKELLLDMVSRDDELNDEDIKFLNTLAESVQVTLSDVQKFILNRIKQLNEKRKTGVSPQVEMRYETALSAANLPQGTATIAGSEEQINFKTLLAADGAASATQYLVNQSLPTSEQIGRSTPGSMEHISDTYHLGAYITLSKKDGKKFELPERSFVSSFLKNKTEKEEKKVKSNELYFLRFNKQSHVKSEEKSVKLGFIGEVTKQIYDEIKYYDAAINRKQKQLDELKNQAMLAETAPDHERQEKEVVVENIENMNLNELEQLSKDIEQEMIDAIKRKEKKPDQKIPLLENELKNLIEQRKNIVIDYARKAAANYLDVDEKELEVKITKSKNPAKDKLKVLTFQGNSQRADKAATEANGHSFYLIGDAYFTPNYALGHGLNDALETATTFRSLYTGKDNLSEDQIAEKGRNHRKEYNQLTSSNASHAILMMQVIRWFRKLGGIRKKMAQILEKSVGESEKAARIDMKQMLQKERSKNEDPIQQYFSRDLFSVNDLEGIFTGKTRAFPIGCLSLTAEEALNYDNLRAISAENKDIPLLLKISDKDPVQYHFFAKNEDNVWTITSILDPLTIGPVFKKLGLDEEKQKVLFSGTSAHPTILSPDMPHIEKKFKTLFYGMLSHQRGVEEMAKDVYEKLNRMQHFLDNNPALFKQYRREIMSKLEEMWVWINNNSDAKTGTYSTFEAVYNQYHQASANYNRELIALAEKNPNKRDTTGNTPLYYAIQSPDSKEAIEVISHILHLGGDPKKLNPPTMVFAIPEIVKNEKLIRAFLDRGVNPFKPISDTVKSPFHQLLSAGNLNFALACLKTVNNTSHPLYREMRKELSPQKIEEMKEKIPTGADSHQREEVIHLLNEIKNKKEETIFSILFNHEDEKKQRSQREQGKKVRFHEDDEDREGKGGKDTRQHKQ